MFGAYVLGKLSRQVVSALVVLSRLVPGCPSCSPVLLGALETAWGPAEPTAKTSAKTSAKTEKTSAKTNAKPRPNLIPLIR